MNKILLKAVLPGLLGTVLLVLALMWGYGYVGVKCGWIKVGDLNGMNAITRSGVDAAGGLGGTLKNTLGL